MAAGVAIAPTYLGNRTEHPDGIVYFGDPVSGNLQRSRNRWSRYGADPFAPRFVPMISNLMRRRMNLHRKDIGCIEDLYKDRKTDKVVPLPEDLPF